MPSNASPDKPHPDWLSRLPKGARGSFQTGEMLCLPNAEDNRLFILDTGLARICLNGGSRDFTIGYLRPGGIYVSHTRAWVEALEPCQIQSWPVRDLLGLITSEPEFAVAALREIGTVLHSALDLVEDLAFRPVEARFARLLLNELDAQGGPVLQMAESTAGLAEALGTSRQTLSTLINRLIKAKVIAREGRMTLRILDKNQLEEFADLSSR